MDSYFHSICDDIYKLYQSLDKPYDNNVELRYIIGKSFSKLVDRKMSLNAFFNGVGEKEQKIVSILSHSTNTIITIERDASYRIKMITKRVAESPSVSYNISKELFKEPGYNCL